MSGLDVTARLRRALLASAAAADAAVEITQSGATRWASATFTGERHDVELRAVASDTVERWLAELPEAELALTGHLVADLKIVAMRQRGAELAVTLEVLTVEEN